MNTPSPKPAALHSNELQAIALNEAYDYCAKQLLANDRELYGLCLYEPNTKKRCAYFAFFALFTEIEKIPALVSEPSMGMLRIKWWYDSISAADTQSSDQTLILKALKQEIKNGSIALQPCLELLEHMQEASHIYDTKDADVQNQYLDRLSTLVSHSIHLPHQGIFRNLFAVRMLKIICVEHHRLNFIACTECPPKKNNLFVYKTYHYIRILRQKISKKKRPNLSVLDLLKLYFC